MKTSFFTEVIPRVHREFRLEIERVLAQFRPGTHRSSLRSFGVEFRGFKQFELSDPQSAVDYVASERVSENPEFEPVSRSYHPERAISVFFLLDIRDSMEEPLKKMEYAAVFLWVFALSAFKSQDQFRIVLFGDTPLCDSGRIYEEGGVIDFFRHAAEQRKFNIQSPATSDVFSYINGLSLRDTVLFTVSDFVESWENELRSLRRLGLSEHNMCAVFFALDEWSGFSSGGYGMTVRDPHTGQMRYRSENELMLFKKKNEAHFAAIRKSIRPLVIPFLTFPIIEEPFESIRRQLVRLEFVYI